MKAVEIQAFGSPEGLAVIDLPDPSPADGQVLIATEAIGVGGVDAVIRSGAIAGYGFAEGHIPGSEVAGTVTAVGGGVDASWAARSSPADQRVDPAAILGFLDAVDERPGVEMHSLMVVRHGRVAAEGWWAPYSAGRSQLLYSLSKSFTSTAAAFAQAEGLFDLDDAVISHFAEFAADITDPRSRSVKVRHVASMASGHTRDMLGEAILRDRGEPVRGFLLIPPDRDPGTVFAYSQPCTYALASIIQRNAGMPLTQYLRPCPDLHRGSTEAGGWQISLIEAANALTLPVGAGTWTVSDHADRNGETIPVAASGGWLDGHTLRAEVIFLETPHRMDITCSLPGRTAEAVWRHPPLTPSKLQHLHCPG